MALENPLVSLSELHLDDCYGNRSFLFTFEPGSIGNGKILGFIKRGKVEVKIRLFTIKEIVSRAISSNLEFAPIIEELVGIDSSRRKLFFYQPNIIYGKEHFVLIFADKDYDSQKFADHSFAISMSKHFWKVAQTQDIIISLDSKGSHKIFINGKKYKYSVFQKYIKEYENLNDALSVCLNTSDGSFIKLEKTPSNLDSPSMILFSDLHLADKTAIDNFGSIKEKCLIEMLKNETKNKETHVVIPGDLFDLWQTTIGNIEKAYCGSESLLSTFSKIKNLTLIAGNHDESIVDKKVVKEWVLKHLPNAKILSNVMILSRNFDSIIYHGDKQDPSNNHTVFGRTVSRIAASLEKSVRFLIDPSTGRSSLEQKLMGFLEKNLSPTKILVESFIVRNLTSFITDINIYIHWNKNKLDKLTEGKRKFFIVLGHTHEMVKNNDNNIIQQVLKLLVDEFVEKTPIEKRINTSYLINNVDIRYVNTGAGSGESLLDEKTKSRTRWKAVSKEMKGLSKIGLGYYEYVRRGGAAPNRNGKQDSIFVYEDDANKVWFSYTEMDYRSKTAPVEF